MGEYDPIRVGIVGASGYGGIQLVRLLTEHPHSEITYLGGNNSAGKAYTDIYPHLQGNLPLQVEAVDVQTIVERCDAVFLSLPNGIACGLAASLLAGGCKVIDLSADYRFVDLSIYRAWYGGDRSDDSTNQQAVYGLPELFHDRIRETNLVGCPGCYPTASLLAIAPLLKQGLAQSDSIIIDAKSGTSGGGRKRKENLLLAEADNSLAAYGVTKHRHTLRLSKFAAIWQGVKCSCSLPLI